MLSTITGLVTLSDAVAISSTNTVNSASFQMDYLSFVTITVTTTGTATGSAKLQGSIDGSTWIDFPNSGSTANISVSGAGSHMWNVPNVSVRYMRVSYTNATNSGNLTVRAFAKGRA
jgi:hypothetical protein